MEGKFELTLKRVFDKLSTTHKEITDDTCFQKLLDILKTKFLHKEEAEDLGTIHFIKTLQTKDVEPAVLTFGIQLWSVISQTEHYTQNFSQELRCFLEFVIQEMDISHPSIGTALYTALQGIIHIDSAFCIHIINSEEFLLKSWEILTCGKSIFLSNAAIQFLTSLINKVEISDAEEDGREPTDNMKSITVLLDKLFVTVELFSKKEVKHYLNHRRHPTTNIVVCSCLKILKSLKDDILKRSLDMQKLSENVLNIIHHNDGEIFDLALECLVKFLKYRSTTDGSSVLGHEIISMITHLSTHSFIKAQKITMTLVLNGFAGDSEDSLMKVITCPIMVCSDFITDPDLCRMVDSCQLQTATKSQCTILMSHSLDCITQLYSKDNSEDQRTVGLPDTCKHVLKLLEYTTGVTGDVDRNWSYLLNNSRVQQKCLDYLTSHISRIPDLHRSIASVIMQILNRMDIESVVYTKCLECLLTILPLISDDKNSNSSETLDHDLSDDFTGVVQRNLCSMRWEIRDTTVEFIQKAIKMYKENSDVTTWIIKKKLHKCTWQTIADSESYVRASALHALQFILQTDCICQDLLCQLDVTLDDVVEEIIKILQDDTEAFVRRSAISVLVELWSSKTLMSDTAKNAVLTVMSKSAVNDFDWEVKLKSVEFWEILIVELLLKDSPDLSQNIPSYAAELYIKSEKSEQCSLQPENFTNIMKKIEMLEDIGCFNALFDLTDDYDQSVVEKTCLLLLKVRDYLKVKYGSLFSKQVKAGTFKSERLEKSENENQSFKRKTDSTPYDGRGSVKVLKLNVQSDQIYGLSGIEAQLSLISKLDGLDLDSLLNSCSVTCDEYDRNPISLLEDILADLESQTQDEDEENVIDCY